MEGGGCRGDSTHDPIQTLIEDEDMGNKFAEEQPQISSRRGNGPMSIRVDENLQRRGVEVPKWREMELDGMRHRTVVLCLLRRWFSGRHAPFRQTIRTLDPLRFPVFICRSTQPLGVGN